MSDAILEAREAWKLKWESGKVKWKCGNKAHAVLSEIRRRRGMTSREIQDYAFRLTHPNLGALPSGDSYWSDAWNTGGSAGGLIPWWCDKRADGKWHVKKYKRIKAPYWGNPLEREVARLCRENERKFSDEFWSRLK
jgi:hypothetical protein